MCDTWVALSNATLSENVIFAKNSDRPIFDCQPLLHRPARQWPAGSSIELEYLNLPQVNHTYATLGSSPYWCWGFEEGINEHGVVIGNEAIFTKTFREASKAHRQGEGPGLGLLGMDLIRLALERSDSAAQAVEVLGALIESYGQFGSGVPAQGHAEGGYDNSFIIADPAEAWILEAVGKRWVASRLSHGFSSISNQPTIRDHWDAGSADVEAYARRRGWWPERLDSSFDFARAYIDERKPRQVSHIRLMRSRQLLAEKAGQITPRWMKRIARDHYEDSFLGGPYFDAADPDFQSICMHASPADFTWGNTASSCIVELPQSPGGIPVFWWTPGPPCNGCYAPFFIHGSALPEIVSRAGKFGKRVVPPPAAVKDAFDPDSYWWLFRRLLDETKGDLAGSLPGHFQANNLKVRARFDALEEEFAASLPAVIAEAVEARAEAGQEAAATVLDEFTAACVNKVLAALKELMSD